MKPIKKKNQIKDDKQKSENKQIYRDSNGKIGSVEEIMKPMFDSVREKHDPNFDDDDEYDQEQY